MNIEVLGRTTIWDVSDSKIDKEIPQRETDCLRIIIGKDINIDGLKVLVKEADNYPRVRVVLAIGSEISWVWLKNFENLIGVQAYGLTSTTSSLLRSVPSTILELEVGFESIPKNGLRVFDSFDVLESLTISGKFKGIEGLGCFNHLKRLSLHYVSAVDLSSQCQLADLNEIELHHGSAINCINWNKLVQLKKLVLWKTKGIDSLEWLLGSKKIESIEIGALAQINELPLLVNAPSLTRIKIEQLKSLSSISALADIKPLKYLHIVKMNQIPLEDYKVFIGHKVLGEITCGYSSRKKCSEVSDLLGLNSVTYRPFWEENEF